MDGTLWGLGVLALVLLYFWSLGRKWSKIPPKPKRPRQPLSDAEQARRLRRWLWWSVFWP